MNSKRRRSHSPVEYKEGCDKDYETSGRKDNSRDLEESKDTRLGRGHDSGRHTDRHSFGTLRDSKRQDDYRRYHDMYSDDYGRSHTRASRSDRESRTDTYYDRSKRDYTSGRSRGDQRDVDSRYGEKSVSRDPRSINERKQGSPRAYQRNDIGEYNKYTDARKQEYRGYGDDRDHCRVVDKNKETIKEDEVLKKRDGKEIEKEALVETREKRRSLFSSTGTNTDNPDDAKLSSVTNEALDNSAATLDDGVNAAKVAAMKAAELVNRNISAFGAGTGRLSTDQKKKLLWGNKKSNTSEETSNRWDLNLFSDRERQKKFNKLMGVKNSAPVQEKKKVENMDGSSDEAKKLEELDTNLEKHYIAGLRRRDGRTVGLGL
ncbi:arginine/serine-rich coiled-coil protein 2 isoform X2 [Panicum miliaceum]|uniref:Arginine/serine-rich coiled-coil protein 2 isoform X2 n=1 Tax=Panicum miliaceum TaxID=4540 RepID=A0A3L6S749_PANMI|nr:arginine/serine-rich coiled-coil protein 2 isoform X2 [Panicum miliaceum]